MADTANRLCSSVAFCERGGNTGTRRWKVNKTRNMHFCCLFANHQFGEKNVESNARDYLQTRLFADLINKQTEPVTRVHAGGSTVLSGPG
jgi:hypothetical protein